MRRLTNSNDWKFFRKGKANLVFKYVGKIDFYKCKVLRLRMEGQVFNTLQVYKFLQTKVRPLLGESVINTELVKVEFDQDGSLNDRYGLLMPDLLPTDYITLHDDHYVKLLQSENSYILEIKPKWLKKSEFGCRNCANYRFKHGKEPSFCSTLLLEEQNLEEAIKHITSDVSLKRALIVYLQTQNNCLKNLYAHQVQNIPLMSICEYSEVTEDVCLQMSLRDVTIFINIDQYKVINTTIIDIDPKSSYKWKKWVSTEKQLIEGGYYKKHKGESQDQTINVPET